MVRASGCGPEGHGFESHCSPHGMRSSKAEHLVVSQVGVGSSPIAYPSRTVVQWLERLSDKQEVGGSIPPGPTIIVSVLEMALRSSGVDACLSRRRSPVQIRSEPPLPKTPARATRSRICIRYKQSDESTVCSVSLDPTSRRLTARTLDSHSRDGGFDSPREDQSPHRCRGRGLYVNEDQRQREVVNAHEAHTLKVPQWSCGLGV